MGFNRSPLAFADCQGAFDRALSSPRGIKIRCVSAAAAVRLRARMNHFRARDREKALTIYDPTHPMYGKSVYDSLITLLEGECVVVRANSVESLDIEEIA